MSYFSGSGLGKINDKYWFLVRFDVLDQVVNIRGLQTFSMKGHIADISKTLGPKLIQSR